MDRLSVLRMYLEFPSSRAILILVPEGEEPPSARLGAGTPPDLAARCGSSSGVEHHVANVGVEGSNPFSRSLTILFQVGGIRSSAVCA